MAWTFYGEFYDDLRRNISGLLSLPTSVTICTLGTTLPITLYNGRDSTTASVIPNGPMQTGVPVGSPGIDAAGGTFFYAPVGKYTPVIDGVSYPPITVYPDLDDLAALGGGTSASGQTLQVVTGQTLTSTTTRQAIPEFAVTLNPGDTYRFDGVPYFKSSRQAGVKFRISATGTGVVMGYVHDSPHFNDTGGTGIGAGVQYDITEERVTTVVIATNGSQGIGGFPPPRTFTDFHITSGSTSLTSATAAFVADTDVGATITGTGIPANATIASVTNGTTAVLSANATATNTAASLTINTLGYSHTKIFGCIVSLPSSAPAPGAVLWEWSPNAIFADSSSLLPILSCVTAVKLT